MVKVTSTIKLNLGRIRQLDRAAVTALERTVEAVHTNLVQSQTMPFGETQYLTKKVYGKRGRFAKNGREYKGKLVKEVKQRGGTLQNESTFVDTSESARGRVSLVSSTPYARRLYYHPEYNFYKGENPDAGGEWFQPYLPGGKKSDFAKKVFKALYKREAGV